MGRVILEVPLIAQCANYTCWYACLQMIVRYHRGRSGNPSIGGDIDRPDFNSQVCELNRPIDLTVPGIVEQIAQAAHFHLHNVSNTIENIERLLRDRGPLFYAGRCQGYRNMTVGAHAVVIRGVNADQLYVNDPGPPNVGLQLSGSSSELFTHLQRSPQTPLLSF